MDIKGKYCAVNIPLNQNPIQFPEWPSFPENITWPELPENITWPWPAPDSEVKETLENSYRLRQWALTLAGLGNEDTRGEDNNSRYQLLHLYRNLIILYFHLELD